MAENKIKVAINFASADELANVIPGLGKKLAKLIVSVRKGSGNITPEILSTLTRRQYSKQELELVDFTPDLSLGGPQDSDSENEEFVVPEQGAEPEPANATWAGYMGSLVSSAHKLWASVPRIKLEPRVPQVKQETQTPRPMLRMEKRSKAALDYSFSDLPDVPVGINPRPRVQLAQKIVSSPAQKTAPIPVPKVALSDSEGEGEFVDALPGAEYSDRLKPDWPFTPIDRHFGQHAGYAQQTPEAVPEVKHGFVHTERYEGQHTGYPQQLHKGVPEVRPGFATSERYDGKHTGYPQQTLKGVPKVRPEVHLQKGMLASTPGIPSVRIRVYPR